MKKLKFFQKIYFDKIKKSLTFFLFLLNFDKDFFHM